VEHHVDANVMRHRPYPSLNRVVGGRCGIAKMAALDKQGVHVRIDGPKVRKNSLDGAIQIQHPLPLYVRLEFYERIANRLRSRGGNARGIVRAGAEIG
jgi:hypothetical protein